MTFQRRHDKSATYTIEVAVKNRGGTGQFVEGNTKTYPDDNPALRVSVGLRVAGTGWRVMLSGCLGLRSCVGW